MAAYLDAIAPEVWLATKTGFTETPTPEQLKWNAKARNAIFEAISKEVFATVNGMVKVIGCSSLRGGGGELGTNKNLDLWLQLVCIKLKLKHAI